MSKQTLGIGKDERRALGAYLDGLERTAAAEGAIAERATQIEAALLKESKRLREAMRRADNFTLRRLEQRYLHVQHRLAMMRRSYLLAGQTQGRLKRLGGGQAAGGRG